MPSMYSDHFSATGVVATLAGEITLDMQKRLSAGLGHARLRYKRAHINVGTAAGIGDKLRLMQFKSSDRLAQLFVTSDGGCTAGAGDLGLYQSGLEHDGAGIDADLFASALVVSAAIARVDEFKEATTLGDGDRGKTLWEQAAVGAASYTVDPGGSFDLVMTITMAVTVAVVDLVFEAIYTSGD